MARSGRRLVIGGSGILSEDDSLAATGARGEVHRYVPLSPEEVARQQPKPAEPAAPAPAPVIVTPPPSEPGGGDGGDTGVSGGGDSAPGDTGDPGPGDTGDPGGGEGGPGDTGDGPGGEGDGDAGDFARGGRVGKGGGRVEEDEFVMSKGAVKKYGESFMNALNKGKIKMMAHGAYTAKHATAKRGFAKGKRLT